MPDLISVIVTTYNREDALDAVLAALSRQSDRDFEVVIADDGSGPATAALVERWRPRLGVPLSHVWQEDRGFRAAEIRNRAILAEPAATTACFSTATASRGPISSPTHRRLARAADGSSPATACCSRGRSPPRCCATACSRRPGARPSGSASAGAAASIGWPPLLRLPLGPLRKLGSGDWRGARSCNLAVWRSDLDRVDGFDASFSGWGREDSDLLIRLLHAGVRRKDGRFATGVMHLWHPEADRAQLPANDARLDAVLGSDRACAPSAACRRCATRQPADWPPTPHGRMSERNPESTGHERRDVRARARLARHRRRAGRGGRGSLPWSTSATGILIVLWLIALVPTLDAASVRREVMSAAGGLPVLLWVLGALGMLWADVTWSERIAGLGGFHKLLLDSAAAGAIPPLRTWAEWVMPRLSRLVACCCSSSRGCWCSRPA